jgi:hypothetical protein
MDLMSLELKLLPHMMLKQMNLLSILLQSQPLNGGQEIWVISAHTEWSSVDLRLMVVTMELCHSLSS